MMIPCCLTRTDGPVRTHDPRKPSLHVFTISSLRPASMCRQTLLSAAAQGINVTLIANAPENVRTVRRGNEAFNGNLMKLTWGLDWLRTLPAGEQTPICIRPIAPIRLHCKKLHVAAAMACLSMHSSLPLHAGECGRFLCEIEPGIKQCSDFNSLKSV